MISPGGIEMRDVVQHRAAATGDVEILEAQLGALDRQVVAVVT